MRATDLFDNYLEGKLSGEQKFEFEKQLASDPVLAKAFDEHKTLISVLNKQDEKQILRAKLKEIHKAGFGSGKTIHINREETFASRHGKTLAVAASTALIAVLSTVAALSTGGYLLKQQSNQITDLKLEVMELQASSNVIVDRLKSDNTIKATYAPANIEGSAFALNNKGYIVTSYHMVKDADSIFIQNGLTERSLTKLVMTDPKLDLAILKLENAELSRNWQVPFALKEKPSDIGERVFTLGYPRREMVYGEGSLSSLSGYSNDTSMYQISVPVNPGNSGGPVLDEDGSIIGVIRGKISGAEATGFAIKANQIIRSIEANAADSTRQELLVNTKKGALKKLKRSEQIKRINPYVFNVLVYNKD